MSKIVNILIILILVGVASGLAYLIYTQNTSTNQAPKTQSQSSQTVKPIIPTPTASPIAPPSVALRALILPSASSSTEVKANFENVVNFYAKETSSVEIRACLLIPPFVKTGSGQTLTINNRDKADHKLTFDSNINYTLKSADTLSIKMADKLTQGIHTLHCDGHKSLAGIIQITP